MSFIPLLAILEPTDYAAIAVIGLVVTGLAGLFQRSRADLRRVEEKLDRLLRHQGCKSEPESASVGGDVPPEVERLARNPETKIEAIKRLREQRPGLGLAEAKAIVDRYSGQ